MQRAGLLQDPVRRWELIQTEGALSCAWAGSALVMAAQVQHLMTVGALPNVDLRIVPAFCPAPFTAPRGFHVVHYAQVVQIGTRSATALLSDRDDLVTYATLFATVGSGRAM